MTPDKPSLAHKNALSEMDNNQCRYGEKTTRYGPLREDEIWR